MKNRLHSSLGWIWNARWATYWYGDEELFQFTSQQFDEKAGRLLYIDRRTLI